MPKKTLRQFAQEERRKDCPVCKLPARVRKQIEERPSAIVAVPMMLRWLKSIGYPITAKQYDLHCRGRHKHRDPKW